VDGQEAAIARPVLEDPAAALVAVARLSPMPMLVTDPNLPDDPVVFANDAFLALTGYPREEILGRNCRFLQGALTDRATVRLIGEALAARRPVAVEVLNYRRDGTPFWNALFISPVFGPDGRLLRFLSAQHDASARREAEDALRRAQRMEAIGELAAGLAHDLNNALHVVLGNLGRAGARLPGDEAEVRKALDRARRAGEHVAALTRQVLTFARRARLQPRPVVLNTVLAELDEALSRTLGEGLDLRFDLDPGLPPCVIDPTQVQAALLNLLANAREAMRAAGGGGGSGGRATVRTGTVWLDEAAVVAGGDGLRPGRYVLLAVEDDGPGMPPEVLARAAEPFFTTKPGKGTGLGLAAAHGFARQSGGRLEVSSGPGRGTTVRLLFPAAASDAQDERTAPPPPSNAEPVLDARGGTETVLVVDDDAAVLDLAVHHLTALGYRVLSAQSGEAAMELLARAGAPRVDLLFTDIVMPGGVNGLALAARARALRPGLRVLLASGYSDDLLPGGAGPPPDGVDVLAKPYRRTDLAGRVRAALDRPAAPGSGARPTGDLRPRDRGPAREA
jgi:PAS domain S-box-containing protein